MSKPKKKVGRPKKAVVKLTKKGKLTSVKIKKVKTLPEDKNAQAAFVSTPTLKGSSRNDLMLAAKEKGVKNYRVLNKAELIAVINPETPNKTVLEVIKKAVDRWQSGWGHKGGRVHKIITKGGKK